MPLFVKNSLTFYNKFLEKAWAFSFFLKVLNDGLNSFKKIYFRYTYLEFLPLKVKWKSRDFQPSYRVWSAPLPWQTFRCSAGKCKVWVPNGLPWCVCPSSFALGTPCDKTCTFSAPRLRAASSAGRRTSSEGSVHKSDTWPSWDRFQSERSCVPSTSCHSEMEEQYYSTSSSIVDPCISIN